MPSTQSVPERGRIIATLFAFLLGFLLAAALIHLTIRRPLYLHADIRSEKLALLHEWAGKAQSASFGSSHVHNGFDPRAFDHVTDGTPLSTNTLNLGVLGGSQSEQRIMALEFLRMLHPDTTHACFMVMELTAGANFTNDHLIHPRAINIYDWRTTRLITHFTSPAMGMTQHVARIGYALAAMGLHYFNVGMLSNRIFPAPLDADMMRQQTIEDRRGLMIFPEPEGAIGRLQKIISDAPKQPHIQQGLLVPGNRELIDELAAASPIHNLHFVYLVMPKISDLSETSRFPEELETADGPVPIINLAQPDVYPQLYQANLWLDQAHLDEAGATLATQLAVQRLQQWYAKHGQPGPCGR